LAGFDLFSIALAGPRCDWAVCRPRRDVFFAGVCVSTGFFSATVGATLIWGFGALGV